MDTLLLNNITLSKEAPQNLSLNFEALREEGITHITRLGKQLWTDHNLHDPGITILEVLCYAITDLAYRTDLPIEDILAKANDINSSQKSSYSISELLNTCPVTNLDYRKLLIDINGVKNAWIERLPTSELGIRYNATKNILEESDDENFSGKTLLTVSNNDTPVLEVNINESQETLRLCISGEDNTLQICEASNEDKITLAYGIFEINGEAEWKLVDRDTPIELKFSSEGELQIENSNNTTVNYLITEINPLTVTEPTGPQDLTYVNISEKIVNCLLYTSPSPRDATLSRMPSSA